jgi:hypothetical protein
MPADGKVIIGDPMPPESDPNLTIGDPMPSVPDPILTIKSYRHRLPSVTKCPRLMPGSSTRSHETFHTKTTPYF